MNSRLQRSFTEQVLDLLLPLAVFYRQRKLRLRRQPTAPALLYVIPRSRRAPGAYWATDTVGRALVSRLKSIYPGEVHCLRQPLLARRALVHYGELGAFLHFSDLPAMLAPNRRNRIIATVFHVILNDQWGSDLVQAAARLLEKSGQAERIVTASLIMERRLQDLGIPSQQLLRLPLGVDLSIFQLAGPAQKLEARAKCGIPANVLCIGSFQKDGVGWGEGLEPKLIKGPDVFLKVVAQLKEHFPLFVLLTGPARGYMRQGLHALGVPYRHVQPEEHALMADCYRCLDLYLITSREEGGPHALLEALACGVPLVSTAVGMAPELIRSGENGVLTAVDDLHALTEGAARLLQDAELRQQFAAQGLQTVQAYDWDLIALRYWQELYQPLLEGGS